MLHDLQLDEAREQQRKGDQHRGAGDADAQLEKMQLLLVVFEFGQAHDFRLPGSHRFRRGAAAASAEAW
ncbi:hypothetical protein D3C83_28090 [compost metagenome]